MEASLVLGGEGQWKECHQLSQFKESWPWLVYLEFVPEKQKAEGQPSPTYVVGKQRQWGQLTIELLSQLSRITSSKKKKKSKLPNRKQLGMKCGWASQASIYRNTIVWMWLCQFHRTQNTQRVPQCMVFKRLISAWPEKTLIKETLQLNHQVSRLDLAGQVCPTLRWLAMQNAAPA